MKKFLSIALALVLTMSLCAAAVAAESIQVAAIETAYGSEIWAKVAEAFTAQTGIEVDLITDKNLEDVIGAAMQGGEFPDVIHLATGRPAGLTEQFIKDNNMAEITDVLSMTVPGEVLQPVRPVLQRWPVRGKGLGRSEDLGRDVGAGRDRQG